MSDGDLLWCKSAEAIPFVEEALASIDEGYACASDPTAQCLAYALTLNRLFTGFRIVTQQGLGDDAAAKAMIFAVPDDDQQMLATDERLQPLRDLTPLVRDQNVLNAHEYNPYTPLAPTLELEATDLHRRFNASFDKIRQGGNSEARATLLRRLSELLWIIRCNLVHGEKTRFGPDFAKLERDKTVCEAAGHAFEAVFDAVLDRPHDRLAAYGTLRTGKPGRAIMPNVPDGVAGVVHGYIAVDSGLPYLTPGLWRVAPEVEVEVFEAASLRTTWNVIDKYEGPSYKRCHILARLETGQFIVAQTYKTAIPRH